MFSQLDPAKNEWMLTGPFRKRGYDWWWHSFTAHHAETGEEKPFFIEYFTVNPALGGAKPVFGQLPENQKAGVRPSYLMVKAGCWGENARQVHRFFGWDSVKIHGSAPFSVEAGDCYCSDKEMRGRGFTSPWVWLSSNDLVSNITGKKLENSAFDVGGGRPKIYFMALNRKLLGGFCYEGDCYEFNFSKLWTYCRTDFDYEETEDEIIWHVNQETFTAAIEYDIHCFKKDMLFIKYEDPDGRKRHNRLWNGGNGTGRIKLYKKQGGKRILVDDVTARHIGCEYGEYGHYDEAGKYITERP